MNTTATTQDGKGGRASVAKPNHGQGFSSKRYNPKPGERTFKRFGAEAGHGINEPHVHQPLRNATPNCSVFGEVGTKNGGVTAPTAKDIKQLYGYLNNNKYH